MADTRAELLLAAVLDYHEKQVATYQAVIDNDDRMFSDETIAEATLMLPTHELFVRNLRLAMDEGSLGERTPAAKLEAILAPLRERLHGEAEANRGPDGKPNKELLEQAGALTVALFRATLLEMSGIVRHKDRGSSYNVFGQGILQTSRPLVDNDPLILYRDASDGKLFARPPDEFGDGRFEPVDLGVVATAPLVATKGHATDD